MTPRAAISAPLLAALMSATHAQPLTGNTLYTWLMDSDRELTALMYIRGFVDAQLTALRPLKTDFGGKPFVVPLVCAPEGSTVAQGGDIVRRALATKPESRHEPAPQLIRKAFFDAGWKCSD